MTEPSVPDAADVQQLPVPPGDSAEQRAAETVVLHELSTSLAVELAPHRFALDGGVRVTVDGFAAEPLTLVEVWAHQGPPKSAQKHKVMQDALKLAWLRDFVVPDARCILALTDDLAAAPFRSRSWMTRALADLRIEVLVVPLPTGLRERLLDAQRRQYR